MSLPAAKRVRRDLRRAFGDGVLETVDAQGATMQALANTITTLRREVGELAVDYGVVKAAVLTGAKQIMALEGVLVDRSFWGRLRWLVTGR